MYCTDNHLKTRVTLPVLSLVTTLGIVAGVTTTEQAQARSRHEKISGGIGNIVVGEVLPYNNDAGYRNRVAGTVKRSQLSRWKTFYFRVFLPKRMNQIKHDIRVLAMTFRGEGGRARQFNRMWGGTAVAWRWAKHSSASYHKRTEWSVFYPFPKGVEMRYTLYRKYKPKKPRTFRMDQSKWGNPVLLSPALLAKWKRKYKLSRVYVTMNAYTFRKTGFHTSGDRCTKRVVRPNGSIVLKKTVCNLRGRTTFDRGRFLAKGKFVIVMD